MIFVRKLSRFYWRFLHWIGRGLLQLRLKNKTFTVISNDCWGGELYKNLNLPFNSPFIGLMIMSPCYIKLLNDLRHYLSLPLKFVDKSQYQLDANFKPYPIGVLDSDIEIHFLHYKSEEEAKEKWTRRVNRINWENILVKYDATKDFATSEHLITFSNLKFPKIAFSADKLSYTNCIQIKKYTTDGQRIFYSSLKEFDVIDWLNGGDGDKTIYSVITSIFLRRKR